MSQHCGEKMDYDEANSAAGVLLFLLLLPHSWFDQEEEDGASCP